MKVQLSLDDKLMERVDAYADNNYMSRSGLISFATTQFLNQADVISAINEMSLAMRKIADKGMVDDETRDQLEDFERICKMLTGKQ